jgi:serine phosphatase RsbU (regulator of sigma subunit)
MEQSIDPSLPDAVATLLGTDVFGVLVGSGHLVEFASERARELLGLADDDREEIDWVAITPPHYRNADDDAMREAVTTGATGWLTKQFLRPDASLVTVQLLVIALERQPFRWLSLLRPVPEPSRDVAGEVRVAGSLLRLARRLAGTGSTEEVFAVVDRLLAPALGAAYANVALLDTETGTLRIHHDPSADDDIRERWVSVPSTADTLLGDAVQQRRLLVCHDLDELRSRYPAQGTDAEQMGLTALAAAPLRADDGRVLGVLGAGWQASGDVDLDLMRAGADLVANAMALAETVDFDRRAAATFQQMLLPASSVLQTSLDVAVGYRAVERVVGGDFYDVIERDDTTWLVVGDVVGHGLRAARTMGKVRFFIRALAGLSASATELLRAVNQLLVDERQSEMVTCLIVRCPRQTGTVSISTAGHPTPIVVEEGGAARQLRMPANPPLGLPDWPDGRIDTAIPAPWRLLAFTDGLVERRGEIIDRGVERVLELVDANPDAPVAEITELLLDADLGTGEDDVAVLCVQLTSPAAWFGPTPTGVRRPDSTGAATVRPDETRSDHE